MSRRYDWLIVGAVTALTLIGFALVHSASRQFATGSLLPRQLVFALMSAGIVAAVAALDYRRIIDVPGYDKIPLHPAARMIGTMNYGYAGTRELNEALVSRFLVIDMPPLTEETLFYLMQSKFPDLKPAAREALAGLYLDLQKKAKQAEITTRALDLRGLFGAIGTMRQGLSPYLAVQIGIVNKCFDLFEKEIVRDVVRTRIPEEWTPQDIF